MVESLKPESVLWACPSCHLFFRPEDRTAHESYSTCFNKSVPMEYFAKMPKPVETRTVRPFIVGYMPTRFKDKLSYTAQEIDPDLWKLGQIKGSLPMAAVPLKVVEAVSERDAISKMKEILRETAAKQGKTYADMAARLHERYYA